MAITGIDTIEGKQIIAAGAVSAKSAEMAYNDENGNPITGYQIAGDYYSASNPSGFITGVDLTPYQTTAGMTAYLTIGDSAEFMTTAERSDYIPTGVSSEFYTTANTANYISEIPNTYLQNTDLTIADNKVTEISGIPLSAGDELPEGLMNESAVEYNAVNEISGYNGSAIAQYGAEKQFLTHDDTLVHLSNSAQYALGCNISAIAQLLGVDETVLWTNPGGTARNIVSSFTLDEPVSSFKELKFYFRDGYENTRGNVAIYNTDDMVNSMRLYLSAPFGYTNTSARFERSTTYKMYNGDSFSADCAILTQIKPTGTSGYIQYTYSNVWTGMSSNSIQMMKVIGIGRKS